MSLPGLFDVAAKYRMKLMAVAMAVAAMTFLATLLVPNSYKATTTILDPERTYSQSGLADFIGIQQKPPGIAMSAAILKSRNATERLIGRFDLGRVYGESNPDELVRKVHEHVSVLQMKDGIIQVSVKDADPQLAADMANALIDILRDILREMPGARKHAVIKKPNSQMVAAIYELAGEVSDAEPIMIHVLDEAQKALKPEGPKRLLLTLMGALLGMLGTLMYGLVRELRAYRSASAVAV